MTNINLPGNNSDIFNFGFDKNLNRNPEDALPQDDTGSYSGISSSPVQGLGFGGMVAGTQSSLFVVDPQKGLWLGDDTFANAPFRVNMSGEMAASSGTFTGTITATTGSIGGFSVGTDYIKDAADSMGLASTVTGGDDVRFWAGSTFANRATAPFRVTEAGAVTGSSVTITGGSVSGVPISSIPNNSSTDISLLEFSHNLTFSVTDADTVAWTSGTITLSNGRTFSISAGNTGNMAALTYIYLDPGTSSTVLQTTTTFSTAVGANKLLVGMGKNNTVTASFIPFGGGQPLIDGQNIGAASVTATNIKAATITTNEIAASTITGTNIATMNISGKNATFDTGTIGGFTMSATDLSATNFNVVSGAANTARVTVGTGSNLGGINSGNAAGDIAFWSGATFANRATAPFRVDMAGNLTATSATLSGFLVSTKGTFGGNGSDGALSITSGTTTLSAASANLLVKNYTSISITSTGKLGFSNPGTNGTIIILKSQGNVTLTSSTIPNIDASAMGAAGGTGGIGNQDGNVNRPSSSGTNGNSGLGIYDDLTTHVGVAGPGVATAGVQSIGQAGGVVYSSIFAYTRTTVELARRSIVVACGSGGGGGAGAISNQANVVTNPTGSAGGRGGGGLIIECNGAWNFTSALGISVAGQDGVVGTNGTQTANADSVSGGAGGGGGAGGFVVALYNTLTANSGTVNSAGGAGGNGGSAVKTGTSGTNACNSGAGGSGAGSDGGAGGQAANGQLGNAVGANGSAAAGRRGGGGGASGGATTSNNISNVGGTGGAGGASENVLVTENTYFG